MILETDLPLSVAVHRKVNSHAEVTKIRQNKISVFTRLERSLSSALPDYREM